MWQQLPDQPPTAQVRTSEALMHSLSETCDLEGGQFGTGGFLKTAHNLPSCHFASRTFSEASVQERSLQGRLGWPEGKQPMCPSGHGGRCVKATE